MAVFPKAKPSVHSDFSVIIISFSYSEAWRVDEEERRESLTKKKKKNLFAYNQPPVFALLNIRPSVYIYSLLKKIQPLQLIECE